MGDFQTVKIIKVEAVFPQIYTFMWFSQAVVTEQGSTLNSFIMETKLQNLEVQNSYFTNSSNPKLSGFFFIEAVSGHVL